MPNVVHNAMRIDPMFVACIELQQVADRYPGRRFHVEEVKGRTGFFALSSGGLRIAEGDLLAFAEFLVGVTAAAIEQEAGQALSELHGHAYRAKMVAPHRSVLADFVGEGSARVQLMTPALVNALERATRAQKEIEDARSECAEAGAGGSGEAGAGGEGGGQQDSSGLAGADQDGGD